MATRLPGTDYESRIDRVRNELESEETDAAVWFDATSIAYLTGFHHIQTERPVMLAITPEQVLITVPRLEFERVQNCEQIDEVRHYFDYPGGAPIETAAGMLEEVGVESVLADSEQAPGTMGYEGAPLTEYVDVDQQDWVTEWRKRKSESEIDLIRTSAQWANLGHRYLADLLEVGSHPVTVSQQAATKASRAMLDTLGDRYVPRTRGDGPVRVGFISGDQTALPHGHTANRTLQDGDPVITGATAIVDGYLSELERTMFVGQPSSEDERYFELMCEAQSIAIETMAPGVAVSTVDEAVRSFFESHNVEDLTRHHVGHAIGLDGHEPPYIDIGSDAVCQSGHVYTIEPGLYTDTVGYRHSDTVVITEDDVERLTYFPRDLASNTIA